MVIFIEEIFHGQLYYLCFVFLNEYFWFVIKGSIQDPLPLKQVVVLIKLIKLYRSTNSFMLLLYGVKLKSLIMTCFSYATL